MVASPVVTSEDVTNYLGMVESEAFRFSRLPEMQNDEDDFIQEGLESVLASLRAGKLPSHVIVVNAMRDWARYRRRQLRGSLPLDELGEPMLARLAA